MDTKRDIPDDPDALLTEAEASDLLGLSTRTLQAWRCQGTGPRFVRAGGRAIRYRRRDLIEWMESNSTPPTLRREAR